MILSELPRAIARHLASKPFFQGPVEIPVRAFCEKDIVDWIAVQQASLGLSVTVYSTGADVTGQAMPGCVRLEPAKVIVEIKEKLEVNRSQGGSRVAAESVAEAAAAYLQGHYPLNAAGIRLENAGILNVRAVVRAEDPGGDWLWQVQLDTTATIKGDNITQENQEEPDAFPESDSQHT